MVVFRHSLEELWPVELGCSAELLGPRGSLRTRPWRKREVKASLQTIICEGCSGCFLRRESSVFVESVISLLVKATVCTMARLEPVHQELVYWLACPLPANDLSALPPRRCIRLHANGRATLPAAKSKQSIKPATAALACLFLLASKPLSSQPATVPIHTAGLRLIIPSCVVRQPTRAVDQTDWVVVR